MKFKHPYNAVVVGQMKVGKSFFIKTILGSYPKKNVFVFDPNIEYKDFNSFYDIDKFAKLYSIAKNCVFVFEEATGFVTDRNREKIVKTLIRNRHVNNSVIFVFHSIRSIPVWIFDYLNYFVAFRTNDRLGLIKKKYEDVFTETELKKILNLPVRKALIFRMIEF